MKIGTAVPRGISGFKALKKSEKTLNTYGSGLTLKNNFPDFDFFVYLSCRNKNILTAKTEKVRYTPHIIGVSVPFRLSNAEIKVIR